VLTPLGLDDVDQLVANALHRELERGRPLAQMVQEKAGGIPFFAIQFLTSLADDGLLAFDPDTQNWQWVMNNWRQELQRQRSGSHDGKLKRLSAATQKL
jgi:predicted ATPase